LADECERRELKTLLANGIAYCSDCHWEEHRRLGGYEYGGANKAFKKLNGLECLGSISDRATTELYFDTFKREQHNSYELLLQIIKDYEEVLKEWMDIEEYEHKAMRALSALFYLNVYEELDLLNWNKMSEWTREELLNAVEVANECWNSEVEDIAQEYNKRRK